MKYIFAILLILISSSISAQEKPKGRVTINVPDIMKNVSDRSMIAYKCSQISNAIMYLYIQGKLTKEERVLKTMNEVAKFQKLGHNDDPSFNEFINDTRIDPKDEMLVPAFFLAMTNIRWLEEKIPYEEKLSSVYDSYLAASCASTAKVTYEK